MRRPNGRLPANPTEDECVSYALASVEMALEDAVEQGAERDEIVDLVDHVLARTRRRSERS